MDAVVWHGQEVIGLICIDIRNISSIHDIGVNIYRIYRVWDQDDIILVKKVCNVSGITLGTIGYKNFVGCDRDIVLTIIINNRIAKKRISMVWSIALECLSTGKGINAFVELFDDRGTNGECHIANTQTNHFFVGIVSDILVDAVCNFRKEIAFF